MSDFCPLNFSIQSSTCGFPVARVRFPSPAPVFPGILAAFRHRDGTAQTASSARPAPLFLQVCGSSAGAFARPAFARLAQFAARRPIVALASCLRDSIRMIGTIRSFANHPRISPACAHAGVIDGTILHVPPQCGCAHRESAHITACPQRRPTARRCPASAGTRRRSHAPAVRRARGPRQRVRAQRCGLHAHHHLVGLT